MGDELKFGEILVNFWARSRNFEDFENPEKIKALNICFLARKFQKNRKMAKFRANVENNRKKGKSVILMDIRGCIYKNLREISENANLEFLANISENRKIKVEKSRERKSCEKFRTQKSHFQNSAKNQTKNFRAQVFPKFFQKRKYDETSIFVMSQ